MSVETIVAIAVAGGGWLAAFIAAILWRQETRGAGDLRLELAHRDLDDRTAERDQAVAELAETRQRDQAELAQVTAERDRAEKAADAHATDQELRDELMRPDDLGIPR